MLSSKRITIAAMCWPALLLSQQDTSRSELSARVARALASNPLTAVPVPGPAVQQLVTSLGQGSLEKVAEWVEDPQNRMNVTVSGSVVTPIQQVRVGGSLTLDGFEVLDQLRKGRIDRLGTISLGPATGRISFKVKDGEETVGTIWLGTNFESRTVSLKIETGDIVTTASGVKIQRSFSLDLKYADNDHYLAAIGLSPATLPLGESASWITASFTGRSPGQPAKPSVQAHASAQTALDAVRAAWDEARRTVEPSLLRDQAQYESATFTRSVSLAYPTKASVIKLPPGILSAKFIYSESERFTPDAAGGLPNSITYSDEGVEFAAKGEGSSRGASVSLLLAHTSDPEKRTPSTGQQGLAAALRSGAQLAQAVAQQSGTTKAAADVRAELSPLGLSSPVVGGVDLSSVALRFVADRPSHTGGSTFFASLEPKQPGEGASASVSLLAFLTTLVIPDAAWWVNLTPTEPDRITDPNLARTDIGRSLLEADLELKHLSRELMDPKSPTGEAYWREAIDGPPATNLTIIVGEWIVPGECVISATDSKLEIYKCDLDVRMAIDHIAVLDRQNPNVDAAVRLQFERHLNDRYILPALRRAVNSDPRFSELRAIYKARALAVAYKQHFGRAGALSEMIGSLNMKLLPQPSKPEPKTIWSRYNAEFHSIVGEGSLLSSNGILKRFQIGGGVVLDDIRLREPNQAESKRLESPPAFSGGIVTATSLRKSQPLRRLPILTKALQAHQEAGARAEESSTGQLLYALAMTHDSAYGAIRRTAAINADMATADALQSQTADAALESANPLTFAVWTRLHPKAAMERVESHPDAVDEFSMYLAAVKSAPGAHDPDPELLDRAFVHLLRAFAKSGTGDRSAEFAMAYGALSVGVAPRTAPRVRQLLMSPGFRSELYRNPEAVWDVAVGEALFDVTAAADLLLALQTSYHAQGREPPDRALANVRRLIKLGRDLRELGESQEPLAKVQAARFEWIRSPSKAVADVLQLLRETANSMTTKTRDQLLLDAFPILASEVPQEAERLAASIHDPSRRSEALSWLAMFSFNGSASQLLLSQQILFQAHFLEFRIK